MTRFVVDSGVLLRLAVEGRELAPENELLAPTLVRSQTLSSLHEAVHAGELPAEVAREHLAAISRLQIRLLGDAKLRKVAWQIADQLGWASTYDAEYIALTKLQADALVTLDQDLARSAATMVAVEPIGALWS